MIQIRQLLKNTRDIHHLIYVFLLIAFVIFLPTSKYMTSVLQFLIAIHWALRADFKYKLKRLKENKAVWIFLLLFLWHLAGLIYSKNMAYGWHDIKIKIPLLILPVVIASSEKLNKIEMKLILLFFVTAVFSSSLVTIAGLNELLRIQIQDFREASLVISHIRFALLVDLSIFILSFFALRQGLKRWERLLYYGGIGYFILFLLLSKSMTGLVIGLIVGLLLSFRWLIIHSGRYSKWIALAGIVALPILVSLYIRSQINDFYFIRDDIENLELTTSAGNPYWHDSDNHFLENGYHVGVYLCEPELEAGWNKLSKIPYRGRDEKGHAVKNTLIRYLTSKGLRKDYVGVSSLTNEDIKLIEKGYANVIYKDPKAFQTRIYQLIWQLDVYKKGGNPSGHSLTQRIEYLKTGFSIFLDNPVFGVGTGDVADAFSAKYKEINTCLEPVWQLRAHNQWLTFAIALGSIGLIVAIVAFFGPGILMGRFKQYLFLLFFLVAFISMFNEDTLETQAGVAFIAFFYPLFLFSVPNEPSMTKTKPF
ncbi:MAG: O-antigen ligase family protein [Bacteroidetes bacterium]|nr:O-antigen ligase family protein [Bacteroidota bacterium]